MKVSFLPLPVVVLVTGLVASLALIQSTDKTVIDVSWPNCKISSSNNLSWGIVGVTGGLDFRPNPCLATESSWFVHLSLYVNTGYPGPAYAEKFRSFPEKCSLDDFICLAYNYGYNASLYAINYAAKEGVHSSQWWLDVETDNSWSADPIDNRASLEGAVDALRQSLFIPITVGFYAVPSQWDSITGSWLNELPSWVGTGSSSPQVALSACHGVGFTGGQIWLSQYTQQLDNNLVCSPQFT